MLRFLLDEHLRGPLWSALVRHNALGGLRIDVVRIGDPTDLPLGSADADILLWAERESRILITEDVHTIPSHLGQHLLSGHRSPGVFIVRVGSSIQEVVEYLELVAHAGIASDFEGMITFVPGA